MAADRPDYLRRTAAECLPPAQTTTDSQRAPTLILTAGRPSDTASRAAVDFDSVVQGVSDDQMTRAHESCSVMQQQQQVQPPKKNEKD